MAKLFPKRLVFRFGWTVAVLLFFSLASSSQAQTRSAAPKARSLYDIQFDSRPEEMEIRINTNGRIPDHRVMQMFNPHRLVIDIPGLDNTSGKKKVSLDHSLVREVRIGQHPDRVRVVLDFPGRKFPSYQIIKKERGLVLILKKDKTDETPVQKEPVPKSAAPVPAEKPGAKAPEPKAVQPAMAVPSPKIDQQLALTDEKRGAQPGEGPPAGAKADVARLETPDYRGAKVSLDYRDADVREVLHKIAEVSGTNIIASEAVRGAITLRLVDIPWDQALDIILQNRNLAKIRQGNIILILTQPEFEQGKK